MAALSAGRDGLEQGLHRVGIRLRVRASQVAAQLVCDGRPAPGDPRPLGGLVPRDRAVALAVALPALPCLRAAAQRLHELQQELVHVLLRLAPHPQLYQLDRQRLAAALAEPRESRRLCCQGLELVRRVHLVHQLRGGAEQLHRRLRPRAALRLGPLARAGRQQHRGRQQRARAGDGVAARTVSTTLSGAPTVHWRRLST